MAGTQEWTLYVEPEPGVCPSAATSLLAAIRGGAHDDDDADGDDGRALGASGTLRGASGAKLLKWRVRSSLPLAAAHNVGGLRAALGVDDVRATFLFHRRAAASASPHRGGDVGDGAESATTAISGASASSDTAALSFLDPSCTPLELLLHDGAVVVASVDPMSHLTPAVETSNSSGSSSKHLRALPGFAAAAFRFGTVGPLLEIVGRSQRKAVRVAPDGWRGGVAVANTPFDSDSGLTTLTFRVSMTKLRSADAAGGYGASGVDADGLRLPPAIGDVLPVAAVGLIDESFDPEGDTATAFGGAHNKAWLLNTVSGQLNAGAKVLTVDRQQYTPGPSVTITLTMDTNSGAVFLTQSGRHIGGFTVSKYLADGMYPCVELYTRGATVELL